MTQTNHPGHWDSCHVNLLSRTNCTISAWSTYENTANAIAYLAWKKPGDAPHGFSDKDTLKTMYLYPPVFTDTAAVNPGSLPAKTASIISASRAIFPK